MLLVRTNEEIHEEQAEFEKFWAMHKSRLDHIMRTCHYKRTVEKVRLCNELLLICFYFCQGWTPYSRAH